MTEKEKQIEEMAKAIFESGVAIDGIDCAFAAVHGANMKDSHFMRIAKHLVCNKGYRKQSGWISIDERLPTEEEYRDEYGELIPILVTEKDTTDPYRALYDGKTWGDGLTAIPTITHWMPLPEPPKMKGGESDDRN